MTGRLLHSLTIVALSVAIAFPAMAKLDTLRYPEDARPLSLLPFFAEDMTSVRMVELIFDSLVTEAKTGEMAPGLATSWKLSSGKDSIRFSLRKGVEWHDGKPFTAADVKFTIDAAHDPGTIFNAKRKYEFIKSVAVVDPHTIDIAFTRPLESPVKRFMFKIIPKHAFETTAIQRTHKFARRPVGTGPFILTKGGYSTKGLRLKANPKYFVPVKLPKIEMQAMPDKVMQVAGLKFGGDSGHHVVIFLPPKELPVLDELQGIELVFYPTVSWWYLGFNHKNKALKDVRVREAITLALDRKELVEANLGRGDVISGPFTEASPFYNFEVKPRKTNLEQARALLKAAGYVKRGQYRKKGKQLLEITFVLDKELTSSRELALGIQGQLSKVGVKVNLDYRDHAAYREMVIGKGKFDMTLNVWSFEEIEDVYPLFHSKGVLNYIGFKSKKVDALLDKAKKSKDYREVKSLMKQVHQAVHTELPYVFLWTVEVYSGVSTRLKNVFILPYRYFSSIEEWEFAP
ncbi:MAG: ABC transporter substrate-binding protein [Bradymonadia bacterium]